MLWRHMCSTDLQATSGSSMKVLWIHWTMEFFLHALVTAGPTAACGQTKKHPSGNHIQGYQMWWTDLYNVQRSVMESSKDKSPFDKLATRATSASENKAWWQYWSWVDVLTSDALYVIQHYCDVIWPWWQLKSTGTRLFYQKIIQYNKTSHYRPLVRETHRWPVDSPHKGPVMVKAFPCRDVSTVILLLFLQICFLFYQVSHLMGLKLKHVGKRGPR